MLLILRVIQRLPVKANGNGKSDKPDSGNYLLSIFTIWGYGFPLLILPLFSQALLLLAVCLLGLIDGIRFISLLV